MSVITYNPYLLGLSLVISSIACYAAIDMLGRFHNSHTRAKWAWLLTGAFVLGTGVWSMHFLSMLAFRHAPTIGHDPIMMFQGWLGMSAAALVGFYVAGRNQLSWWHLLGGAALVACGACGMMYRGVQAMRIQPPVTFDPVGITVCIISVYVLAAVGMWFAYRLRSTEHVRGFVVTALASVFLGLGLGGLHHVALTSVRIPPEATSTAASLVDDTWLGLFTGATMLFIMALGVVAAMLDRRLDRQTANLVESLRSTNALLKHSSDHDALTGLPNRTAVYARIETALARAARTGSCCTLLYVDLDGFKLINDSLGHNIGDRLLIRASGVMKSACESRHLLGRIGGDEFLILTELSADDDATKYLADQIMHRLAGISERGAALSASIGIATYPADAGDTATLVSAADMAMYEAKRAGKHRVQRYLASMGVQLAESFQIQNELRQALDKDELTVYYQPKYSAQDHRLTGAEALVRWDHPERGLVLPGVFIEIAERSGLINELELRVITVVCRQIRSWLDAGCEVVPISINLSVVHLLDDRLANQIAARMREYDVPARYLVFEITETLAMQEFDTTIEVLGQLNALGIDIALDDFGTGYSSLSYLQRLPIQQLKIDRSFIASITDKNSGYSAIVKLIIDLSHALEITVVGEGVETEEQRLHLQHMGCDELQGFLLDRPMPSVDFVTRLVPRTSATAQLPG